MRSSGDTIHNSAQFQGHAAGDEPKVDVAYDRSRHVIQTTQEGGKTAEFEDRPARFLVMDRNPVTKALEPVLIRGEPLYYYLAREVGGDK